MRYLTAFPPGRSAPGIPQEFFLDGPSSPISSQELFLRPGPPGCPPVPYTRGDPLYQKEPQGQAAKTPSKRRPRQLGYNKKIVIFNV